MKRSIVALFSIIALIAIAIITFQSRAQAAITSYEAEASQNTLSGGAVTAACSTCSNGQKVGYVGNNSGVLTFNGVQAPSAGSYSMTVYYLTGQNRSAQMSVNGGAATSVSFPNSGGWTTVATKVVTVSLNAGSNTIRFSNTSGWAPDFDRITVDTPTATTVAPTTPPPTTPPPTTPPATTPPPTTPPATTPPATTPPPTTPPPTTPPASGNCTHYVSTSGNDSNAGTSTSSPWRTIQKAANTVGAGSTVCIRGGTYIERVSINVSGSAAGGFITFQSYPGETAILDGTGIAVPDSQQGLLTITSRNYVMIRNLEIRNFRTTSINAVPIGVFINVSGDHIEIRNNHIHHIANDSTSPDVNAHGLIAWGSGAPTGITNLVIDGNHLHDFKLGWSETMVVNGNVDGFQITNNTVHDADNIGIDAIGFEGTSSDANLDQARNGVISGNLVYNIDTSTNPSYGGEGNASCIYVDGGRDILIERNEGHHCNIGVQLASEHRGKSTSNITVRNNFFHDNTQVGLAVGGYDRRRGSTVNCVIVNNTFYNNYTRLDWGAEMYIQYDVRNTIIRNNIFYANSAKLFIHSWSTALTANTVNNNLFFAAGGGSSGTWMWANQTYTTFAAYQTGSGNDANSLVGVDPLFASLSTPDLHLQTTSPAINAGFNLTQAGTVDFDGQTRQQGGTIDIGADEVK